MAPAQKVNMGHGGWKANGQNQLHGVGPAHLGLAGLPQATGTSAVFDVSGSAWGAGSSRVVPS